MFIGSAILGVEAIEAAAVALGGATTVINQWRNRSNGDAILIPSSSNIQNQDGSAFDEEMQINQTLPDIPSMIQISPEIANQNEGLTFSDDEEEVKEIEDHINNWQMPREEIVINEGDMPPETSSNVNMPPASTVPNVPGEEQGQQDQGSSSEAQQQAVEEIVRRIIDWKGDPSGVPIEPDQVPQIDPENIEYNPHKGEIIDIRKTDKNQEDEMPDIFEKPNVNSKTKLKQNKKFKLDRHNIMAQTLVVKPPSAGLVSKFGFNTRSFQ